MADLEHEGLLAARHASSGKRPTEDALRRHALAAMTSAQAPAMPPLEQGPPDRLLRGAARWLADASHATAVLCAPRFEAAVLRQFRFVPLRDRSFLAIVVTREGLRSECVVESAEPLGAQDLERINDLLAERTDGRSTLREIRDDLERELRAASRTIDRARTGALWLAFQALGAPRPEVVVEGEMNLLSSPELDLDRLRAALGALRDKERLAELLDRTLSHAGPIVWIGDGSDHPTLRGLALIAMPYDAAGALGTIAVLGPARIDYARVASLVDSAARALTTTLAARD
jgi:heat-inducible transcriptional repressor